MAQRLICVRILVKEANTNFLPVLETSVLSKRSVQFVLKLLSSLLQIFYIDRMQGNFIIHNNKVCIADVQSR